jgi:hypothetical protein
MGLNAEVRLQTAPPPPSIAPFQCPPPTSAAALLAPHSLTAADSSSLVSRGSVDHQTSTPFLVIAPHHHGLHSAAPLPAAAAGGGGAALLPEPAGRGARRGGQGRRCQPQHVQEAQPARAGADSVPHLLRGQGQGSSQAGEQAGSSNSGATPPTLRRVPLTTCCVFLPTPTCKHSSSRACGR